MVRVMRSLAALGLLLPCVYSSLTAQEARPLQTGDTRADVRSAGAVGDGKTDDTEAIRTAAKSCITTGGILYLPRSQAEYTTRKPLELPSSCDLQIDGTLKATAPMEAVVIVGADATASRHKIFGLGTIDSGNLAKRHISMANYGHFEITGVTLLNSGAVAGIDIGPDGAKGGFEAYIHDINLFVPPGTPLIPGSAGIWTHRGTDSSVYNLAIVGWDIGVRNNVHSNQPFNNIHVWGFGPHPAWKNVSNLPSVCFDDVAGDAQWTSDECDTSTSIGLHAHGYNDQIIGFNCYNNELWGTDNVVNCIQFDRAKPYSSVIDSIFQGRPGHRLASDIAIPGDSYSHLVTLGNAVISGVVKTLSLAANFTNMTVDGPVNLEGPLNFTGKSPTVFEAGTGGGYKFNIAGNTVAEIARFGPARFPSGVEVGRGSPFRMAGAVVLPGWINSYAGGSDDKSVQLASGSGPVNHLPSYDAKGGLTDSGKEIAGTGDYVPAVDKKAGCLDGWDHLPCTVAKLPPAVMTSTTSLPPATLLTTVASTGVYQVSVHFHSLGGATAGTATPVAVLGQLVAPGTAASMTSTGADGVSTTSITLEEGPGVTLGYALNLSGSNQGARYVISAEIVRLQ